MVFHEKCSRCSSQCKLLRYFSSRPPLCSGAQQTCFMCTPILSKYQKDLYVRIKINVINTLYYFMRAFVSEASIVYKQVYGSGEHSHCQHTLVHCLGLRHWHSYPPLLLHHQYPDQHSGKGKHISVL